MSAYYAKLVLKSLLFLSTLCSGHTSLLPQIICESCNEPLNETDHNRLPCIGLCGDTLCFECANLSAPACSACNIQNAFENVIVNYDLKERISADSYRCCSICGGPLTLDFYVATNNSIHNNYLMMVNDKHIRINSKNTNIKKFKNYLLKTENTIIQCTSCFMLNGRTSIEDSAVLFSYIETEANLLDISSSCKNKVIEELSRVYTLFRSCQGDTAVEPLFTKLDGLFININEHFNNFNAKTEPELSEIGYSYKDLDIHREFAGKKKVEYHVIMHGVANIVDKMCNFMNLRDITQLDTDVLNAIHVFSNALNKFKLFFDSQVPTTFKFFVALCKKPEMVSDPFLSVIQNISQAIECLEELEHIISKSCTN